MLGKALHVFMAQQHSFRFAMHLKPPHFYLTPSYKHWHQGIHSAWLGNSARNVWWCLCKYIEAAAAEHKPGSLHWSVRILKFESSRNLLDSFLHSLYAWCFIEKDSQFSCLLNNDSLLSFLLILRKCGTI